MRLRSQSGFTLIEMLIASAVIPIIFAAIYMMMARISTLQESAGGAITATEKMRNSLRRIADELRTSSTDGEDVNGNGVLDTGEDLNNNGRLEADWATTTSSVTFNRMQPNGTFTLPISYRVRGKQLERVLTIGSNGETRTAILCRSVESFTILSVSNKITVSLMLSYPKRGGVTETLSSSITVMQRN
ncbi:MAG: prepilin-type N-terminal cleavage/methylation domain-containing protein [Planctomycetota bacterium]|nr:prepilin-type N-terminal cleavage/methylation domain-containing protein [Planctomycetota bacterium]